MNSAYRFESEPFEADFETDEGEYVEALEVGDTTPAPVGPVETFAAKLGAEWSGRRNGSPSPDALRDWLLQDHKDTLQGATQRYGKKFSAASITTAWMVSREEQMRFQTAPGLKPLRNFAPPSASVALVSSPLISDSKTAPVAPVMVRFVEQLRQRHRRFSVWNYPRHGGGTFSGRGYSLDFALDGRNPRGFYPQAEAIRFLRAVHETARAVGADWHALYNDFTVADTLNRETGVQHVGFMGTVRRKGKAVAGLNWHGPHPLILHLHVDLAPGSGTSGAPIHTGSPAPVSPNRPSPPPRRTPPARVPTRRPGAPVTGADQETAFALAIAKREVPGQPGTTTQALVEPWRQRISPEIPWPILLAFITKESGGQFTDATHGTAKNNWTSPDFYELGIFQTPGGLHGRCTSGKWSSCEIKPPGREVPRDPSPWVRQCAKIGADPQQWMNPTTQVRVGLADLEDGAKGLRKEFAELFPKPGSDWDLRMTVLYRFSRGGGYARSFLHFFRRQLAAMPEGQRWTFLRDKAVTVPVVLKGGKRGTVTRQFLGENVEAKMALAAKLGYVP